MTEKPALLPRPTLGPPRQPPWRPPGPLLPQSRGGMQRLPCAESSPPLTEGAPGRQVDIGAGWTRRSSGTDVLGGHQGRSGSCEAGAVRGEGRECSRGGQDTGRGWRVGVEQQPYLHPLLSSRVTGVGRWASLQR